jgi:opacity protein-like surface antigen
MRGLRFELVTLLVLLGALSGRSALSQQVTLNVTSNGPPAAGASVVFYAANLIKEPTPAAGVVPGGTNPSALALGNMLKTRLAVTDEHGHGVLDLSNIIKSGGRTQVLIEVRVCEDGKNVVYIFQDLKAVPPQEQKCAGNDSCNCKNRVAGIFIIGDGDVVGIDITPQSIEVHITHPGAAAPGGSAALHANLHGGLGLVNQANINTCGALPSNAACSSSHTPFLYDFGAGLEWNALRLDGGYVGSNTTTRDATIPTSGGTEGEHSSAQLSFGYALLGYQFPTLGAVDLVASVGAVFWEQSLKELQTAPTATGSGAATDSATLKGTSAAGGLGAELALAPGLKLQLKWLHLQTRRAPALDAQQNVVTLGVQYSFSL